MEPDYEVPDNYDLLLKLYVMLKAEEENKNQIIYESRKKIQHFEVLEKEYQDEIEHINRDNIDIKRKFQIRIEQLEEEKTVIRNKKDEEIHCLQKELAETKSEKDLWKEECELNKKHQSIANCDPDSKEDIDELKERIIDMQDIIENLNIQLNICQKECADLKEIEQILTNEKDNLEENLNLKRDELRQANELIQDLQDDVMCLKSELNTLKNKPLDEQSRGNSLFAEVNDSRVHLMKKLKNMVVKYNEMARDRDNLLKEISSLRNEKGKLMELFETEIAQYQPGNQSEIDSYKSTIDGLMNLTERYKEEIKELSKIENSPPLKDLEYYEDCIKRKNTEIASLKKSLELHVSSHFMKARNVSQLGREVVSWKWKTCQLENELQMLKSRMNEEKLNISHTQISTESKLPDTDDKKKEYGKENITVEQKITEKCALKKESANELSKPKDLKLTENITKNQNITEKCAVQRESANECSESKSLKMTASFQSEISNVKKDPVIENGNILKERSNDVNIMPEKATEIMCKQDKQGLKCTVDENVIDLTADEQEEKTKKTVQFAADTKEESANRRRRGKVFVKPLPFSEMFKK